MSTPKVRAATARVSVSEKRAIAASTRPALERDYIRILGGLRLAQERLDQVRDALIKAGAQPDRDGLTASLAKVCGVRS